MAKVIEARKEVAKKVVGEVNPNKAELYDLIGERLVEMFGEDVIKVKQGSEKRVKDGKTKTFKTGCNGLIFEYNGETVAVELTFKDPDTFSLDQCVVEWTWAVDEDKDENKDEEVA